MNKVKIYLAREPNNILYRFNLIGLDPACPGFMIIPLQREHLSKDDGEFVDVIHTSGGTLGCMDSLGQVDFYPNGGIAPQPGSGILVLDSSKYLLLSTNSKCLIRKVVDSCLIMYSAHIFAMIKLITYFILANKKK